MDHLLARRIGARLVPVAVAFVALAAPATSQAGLTPVNLAYLKQARQSPDLVGGVASRAVDGNTDGNWYHNSVTHTDYVQNPFWEVDLGEVRQIGRTEIYNRTDCCAERLASFFLIVSDTAIQDSDATVADSAMRPGVMRTKINWQSTTYSIPVNRSGRYVRIAIVGGQWLSLAEVKVLEAFNAALGRTASQSSVIHDAQPTYAIDGVVSPNNLSATTTQYRPWWQVDLGAVRPLRELHVWSRDTVCCATSTPRKGFWVFTSAQPITGDPLTTTQPGATSVYVSAQGWPAIVPINLDAQYARIILDGTDSLSIAEVQAWTMARGATGGHASQSSFEYGSGTASAAIDFNMLSVPTSTKSQTEPYWDVDLGGGRQLESLRVWTGPTSTLVNTAYNIFVSDLPFVDAAGTAVKTVAGTRALPGVSSFVARNNAAGLGVTTLMRRGRFVRLMMDGTNAITDLREVEVVSTENVVSGLVNAGVQIATPVNPVMGGAWGYVREPGSIVYAYSWVPNFTGGGGYYAYLTSVQASTTPTVAYESAAPGYYFSMGEFSADYGSWPQGGSAGFYFEAAEDAGSTFVPLRTWESYLGESPFWPDARSLSIIPTPDDNATTRPKYLDRPMGPNQSDYDYYNKRDGYYSSASLGQFTTDYFRLGVPMAMARFYNKNELGIGRGATCVRTTAGPAARPATVCQIDNYGPTNSSGLVFGDESASNSKLLTGTPASTVTMIKIDDLPYPIFGAYTAAGARTNIAEHDNSRYNKWLPNNCMSCHGGINKTLSVQKGTMLPFDPFAVTFPGGNYTQAKQVESFRKLNAMVLQSNPLPAVADWITGTYPGGVNVVGSQPDPNYIPGGWRQTPGQRKAYTEVIKPYCRMCHFSQEPADGGLDMLRADDLEAVRALVVMDTCKTKKMPHAQETMKAFWRSGARAQVLGFFGRHDVSNEGCAP